MLVCPETQAVSGRRGDADGGCDVAVMQPACCRRHDSGREGAAASAAGAFFKQSCKMTAMRRGPGAVYAAPEQCAEPLEQPTEPQSNVQSPWSSVWSPWSSAHGLRAMQRAPGAMYTPPEQCTEPLELCIEPLEQGT